jgi:hypothetical protein
MSYEAPSGPPTLRELHTLAAVFEAGDIQGAAHQLGLKEQTVKNRLRGLYARLGAHSLLEAGVKLGWVAVPRETCGWVGVCGRNPGHRGQHGGFRKGEP